MRSKWPQAVIMRENTHAWAQSEFISWYLRNFTSCISQNELTLSARTLKSWVRNICDSSHMSSPRFHIKSVWKMSLWDTHVSSRWAQPFHLGCNRSQMCQNTKTQHDNNYAGNYFRKMIIQHIHIYNFLLSFEQVCHEILKFSFFYYLALEMVHDRILTISQRQLLYILINYMGIQVIM